MEKEQESFNFLKIEIDSRTLIGILERTFYYEVVDFNGDLEELQIPLENIKKIKFKEKRVNIEKTRGNLIGSF